MKLLFEASWIGWTAIINNDPQDYLDLGDPVDVLDWIKHMAKEDED